MPFGFANAKVNDAHMNWWLHNFVCQMDKDVRDQMDLSGDGFVTKNELVAATIRESSISASRPTATGSSF